MASPLKPLKVDGGGVLAGITIHPTFTITAASASAPLTGATIIVYQSVNGAASELIPADVVIAGDGLSATVSPDMSFVDTLPTGAKVVVTCDANQGDVPLVACEYSIIVSGRNSQPPSP